MKNNQNTSITSLHGNTITKRTSTLTPQNDGTIKKTIETFFASGKFIKEEIQIQSMKTTYYPAN